MFVGRCTLERVPELHTGQPHKSLPDDQFVVGMMRLVIQNDQSRAIWQPPGEVQHKYELSRLRYRCPAQSLQPAAVLDQAGQGVSAWNQRKIGSIQVCLE